MIIIRVETALKKSTFEAKYIQIVSGTTPT